MFDQVRGQVPDPYLEELREQTRWLRFLGLRALGPLVETQLKTDAERIVYELSDGERSRREIATFSGVPHQTIGGWWKRWIASGIATADDRGRARRLASLAQLGLAVPTTKVSRPASSELSAAEPDEPEESEA